MNKCEKYFWERGAKHTFIGQSYLFRQATIQLGVEILRAFKRDWKLLFILYIIICSLAVILVYNLDLRYIF